MVQITCASSSNAILTIPNNCASNGNGSVSGNRTIGNGGIHFSIQNINGSNYMCFFFKCNSNNPQWEC